MLCNKQLELLINQINAGSLNLGRFVLITGRTGKKVRSYLKTENSSEE